MAMASGTGQVPWWKEPTKDQWYAWVAAWLGWTLDAFDFTVFLLIIKPISETFHVSIPTVTFVFTITLWARLLGATASGWLGDRIGRKAPLMISILGYSACNFAAGLAPTFIFLFLARALRLIRSLLANDLTGVQVKSHDILPQIESPNDSLSIA